MTEENHFSKIAEKIQKTKTQNAYLQAIVLISIILTTLVALLAIHSHFKKTKTIKTSQLEEKCAITAKEKGYKFYSLIQSSKNPNQKIELGNCAMSHTEDGQKFEIIQVAKPLEKNDLKIKFKSASD